MISVTTKEICKYRKVWMGFAILWIIFYHMDTVCPDFLSGFKSHGYGGVDIFFFASGLGCCCSWKKEPEVGAFIGKRMRRILPTYLIFILPWVAVKLIAGQISVPAAIGNIFSVQQFTSKGGSFNWYIGAMWLTYFLTPYLFLLLDRTRSKCGILVSLALMLLASIAFWNCEDLILIAVRIPVFFLGMWLGYQEERKLDARNIVLLGILFILGLAALFAADRFFPGYRWRYGLYWYPFIAIAPGLCVLISAVCRTLERGAVGRAVVSVFSFVGKYTFELFLVHVAVFDTVKLCIESGRVPDTDAVWYLALIPVAVLSAILHIAAKYVMKLWDRLFTKSPVSSSI